MNIEAPAVDIDVFLYRHPVFTTDELDRFLAERTCEPLNPKNRQALLNYHGKQGHIRRVRRGLWAAVPPGADPQTHPVDTFLIASQLTPDAVLAYATALALHGFSHSLREERVALSEQPLVRPLRFAGVTYRAVSPPTALPPADRMTVGVEVQERQGLALRVTGLERTLVDVLDRPALAGGWEETWRSLEGVAEQYLDVEFIVRYALLMRNATTAAKVGYFLEQSGAGGERLEVLRRHRPRRPHYAERGRREGARLIPGWNLLVPAEPAHEGILA